MGEEGVNVHVGERVGPFVVVANESTFPARKRRVVVRCVVCERVSEMNERSLLDKRTEEQRACAKCRVYTTNGTWVKGWKAKMENAAAEANRLNEENARLRDEIDKVMRERDLAVERLKNEIKAANQARMAEERARESLDELDAAIYDCLPSDYDDDSPLDCVEHAADRLRELAEERDEARAEVERAIIDRNHAEARAREYLIDARDDFRRGAEAMREACARMEPYAYNLDDHLMISKWRSLVRDLPIPEDK